MERSFQDHRYLRNRHHRRLYQVSMISNVMLSHQLNMNRLWILATVTALLDQHWYKELVSFTNYQAFWFQIVTIFMISDNIMDSLMLVEWIFFHDYYAWLSWIWLIRWKKIFERLLRFFQFSFADKWIWKLAVSEFIVKAFVRRLLILLAVNGEFCNVQLMTHFFLIDFLHSV